MKIKQLTEAEVQTAIIALVYAENRLERISNGDKHAFEYAGLQSLAIGKFLDSIGVSKEDRENLTS